MKVAGQMQLAPDPRWHAGAVYLHTDIGIRLLGIDTTALQNGDG